MNQEQQAVTAIRNLLRAFRGLAEIEDSLVDLGSIKQAISETEGRIAKLKEEEAKTKASLEEVRTEVDNARAAAKSVELDARILASRLAEDGEKACKEAIAKAERTCKATEEATRKRLAEVEHNTKVAEDRAKTFAAEADAAHRRYEEIQRKIEEVVNTTRR